MQHLTLLSLLLHPSFFCIAVALAPNISGSSFPFLDSWNELLAVWRSGRRGRLRWFDPHVALSAWQRHRGASGEGLVQTHIYIHVQTRTRAVSSASAVTHVCVESFTHIFSIYVGGFYSTLSSRHTCRVWRQNKLQLRPLKWGIQKVLLQRSDTKPATGTGIIYHTYKGTTAECCWACTRFFSKDTHYVLGYESCLNISYTDSHLCLYETGVRWCERFVFLTAFSDWASFPWTQSFVSLFSIEDIVSGEKTNTMP